jgi:hypothetical protein
MKPSKQCNLLNTTIGKIDIEEFFKSKKTQKEPRKTQRRACVSTHYAPFL